MASVHTGPCSDPAAGSGVLSSKKHLGLLKRYLKRGRLRRPYPSSESFLDLKRRRCAKAFLSGKF